VNSAISEHSASILRRALAYFVAINGVASLFIAAHVYRVDRQIAGGVFFINDTAWLIQHSVIVGLLLILLSRSVARGSTVAHRIVLGLTTIELLKYIVIAPKILDIVGYGLLVIFLSITWPIFKRRSSPLRFAERLKSAGLALLITACAVVVLSVGFHAFNLRAWRRSTLSASHIIKRTLLIEITPDPQDSLKAKLFSQTLSAAGVFLYAWLFLGLFLPSILPHHSINPLGDRELARDLLKRYGTTAEDSLKLWPEDKSYWFGKNDQSAVAYKQSNAVSFALAEPIAHPARRRTVIAEFRDFCRAQGSHACWLIIDKENLANYRKTGHKTLAIGASAIVDIKQFATLTIKDKWWRWARNKATKHGLTHECLVPPHSEAVMQRLRYVSDEWLAHDAHTERTFALGYFDSSFLQSCTIHIARNTEGEIIAFTNQLPTYGQLRKTTVDLMRFLPSIEGAMAYLLSEALLHIHAQDTYDYFDLGFVPLAHTSEQAVTKTILSLSKKVLKPVFSMQGLEQFKNKFDPTWHQNYLAWDGDMLDTPMITASLNKALSIPKR